MKRKSNRVFLWMLTLTVPVLVMALVAEAALRVATTFGYSTFVFRSYDAVLGTALIPGRSGRHQRCYDGYVSINAHGMRDRERTTEKPPGTYRIGIFGDSLTEAVHVQSEQTAHSLLETTLNETGCTECEVLNFSVAGYSTVQEYLRYVTLGRRFDLDVAILVVIPNDVIANVDPVDPMAGSLYSAPYLILEGEEFRLVPPPPPTPTLVALEYIARRSALVLYGTKAYYHVLKPAFAALSASPSASTASAAAHETRWRALRHSVAALHSAAAADGTRLVVVFINVGDGFWGDDDVMRESSRIEEELRGAGLENGFPVHDLGADIARHVREHQLEWPYLSFECDSHYTPRGQEVIAMSLFQFLVSGGLVPAEQVRTAGS